MSDFMVEDEEYQFEEREPRSRLWRILYAIGVLFFIFILFINTSGLSHWLVIGRLSVSNLTGETEADIIERLGVSDYRSGVQLFTPGEGFGMVPQRLDEGDEFYYLNYVIGPRMYVFHFVAPETYEKHTGRVVLGEEWVVLEYYSGNRYVVY
jgi:hypothetical protein